MSIIFRPADWPVAVKLLVAFLFVALTPLVIVGLLSQNQAREGLLEEARRNLSNTSLRTSTSIDEFMRARVTDMQQTATIDSVVRFLQLTQQDRGSLGPNNFDQSSTFNILKSKSNSLLVSGSYLAIASANGTVELTSNNAPGQEAQPIEGEERNISDQAYFKEPMNGLTYYISEPRLLSYSDRSVNAVMYVSTPVRNSVGNPIGVLVLRFNLDSIWQIVNNDEEAVGKGSYGMLIDDSGGLGIRIADSRIREKPDNQTRFLFGIVRPIGTTNRGQWINSGRFPDNFNFQEHSSNQNIPGLVERLDQKTVGNVRNFSTKISPAENPLGENSVSAEAAYSSISSKPGWYYFVVVPESSYAAAANTITLTLLFALGGAILVVIGLAFILARLLTTPVRAIGRVLGRIGMGDFEARVPITTQDELGRLGESLNAMFDNTLSLIQSREEKEVLQERITHLLEEISTVAEGDLTVQAEVTADITGAIADSFNLMIDELRKIIINIQNSTDQASIFFSDAVRNFAQSEGVFNQQAQQVVAVSSAVGDIDRSIQRVSEAATVSADVAQEARLNARQGNDAVVKTISGMNRIRGNVQETSKKIKRLGESSQQISEIVKLIDDIADQTNMLALNAAIQAAMAGEQGKGFSVVSEEVRRLAERSANATREIAALVKSIQDDTAEAIIAMEESTREVVEGSQVADDAGKALRQIENVVERLADLITNISLVSQQQATSSRDIAGSMMQLSNLTQEASELRRLSSDAVQVVASTAEELRRSVSAFKVNTGDSTTAGSFPVPADMPNAGYSGTPLPGYYSSAPQPSSQEHYQYMPPVASSGNAFNLPDDAPEPDFDFAPGARGNGNAGGYDRSAYQPPAGDGGYEPFPVNRPVIHNAQPAQPVQLSKQTNPNDPLDFDLNDLLNDESLLEALFDDKNKPQPGSDNKQRPSALG